MPHSERDALLQLGPSPGKATPWTCLGCGHDNRADATACATPDCHLAHLRASASATDVAGRPDATAPVPVYWLCRTCSAVHLVLAILGGRAGCECGAPGLQAVYDQFGRLFLFWRDDTGVRDLGDPVQLREAARRLRKAGAGPEG